MNELPFFPIETLRREVHCWIASLDTGPLHPGNVLNLLTEDEHARAERIAAKQARRQFIASRALLRLLLANYLDVRPQSLEFVRDDGGKLHLSPESNSFDISFNLSHSGTFLAVAITMGREVGVDIEELEEIELNSLPSRCFCGNDAAVLLWVPPDQRNAAFYRAWTRKEAYLKALGVGWTELSSQFKISFVPAVPQLVAHPVPGDLPVTLQDLTTAVDYSAALAVIDSPENFLIRQLSLKDYVLSHVGP